MVLGIIIGLIIGISITFIICKNKYSKEHDYGDLIKRTLEDLHKSSSNDNSKKSP